MTILLGGLAAVAALSLRWSWWRPRVKAGMPVLMYHSVGDYPAGSPFNNNFLRTKDFRRQMEHLKAKGYTTLTFSDWRDAEEGRRPFPSKPVVITFDDGYRNNYAEAYPVLRELGLKANILLVYEALGGHNTWDYPAREPRVEVLDLKQVLEMQDSGLIEFGSHTMSHPKLTTISPEERRRQLIESKNCLEKALGREVLAFAYPYGDGAGVAEIRADVRAAGYRYDLGIEQGISLLPWDFKAGPIKRLYVARRDGLYDFHLHLTRGAAQRFPALSRDHFREALLRRFRKLRGML